MTRFRDPIAWEATLPVRPSSAAWADVVRAMYGSPIADPVLFAELSGGRPAPDGGADELLVVAGRRGGKSETIARIAVFEALHGGHGTALAPGQVGLVVVISPLREQSGEIVRYVKGLAALPQVKRQVVAETSDSVTFKSGIRVATMTADAVNVSGPTIVMAIREEWAKHPGDDTAMPDREIENSLRPALAPVAGAPRRRLIGITSAYIREGLAFETDRDHFGKPDAAVLVVRGTTEQFNPNIDRAWLARERKRVGERVFAREYLAIWQDAVVDSWFGADVIEGCIDREREVDPEAYEETSYYAAIDAAFRGDRFALAICHREQEDEHSPAITVLDAVWSWEAPRGGVLSVDDTVREVCEIIQRFDALTWGDQFAFDPLKEIFRRHGVSLDLAAWTAATKPARFSLVRNAMTADPPEISLPDDDALVREFHGIRGKLLRSGGERIEGRGHDDLVHAAVLAMSICIEHEPDLRVDGRNRFWMGSAASERSDWRFTGTHNLPGPMRIVSADAKTITLAFDK